MVCTAEEETKRPAVSLGLYRLGLTLRKLGETWESLCDMMFREDVQRGEEFLAALFACPDPIIERQHV